MSSVRSAGAVDDDMIQPFQIDASHLRGRLVRLGDSVDSILNRHNYPPAVAQLLGETLTLAVVLAGALKYEGVFTLQTKGKGPISLMVADVTSDGALRGYAQFDTARLEAALEQAAAPGVHSLLGQGYLAFTVDQGQDTDRYQGIVELTGETMAECVQHYFRQSEQLETGIQLAVGRTAADHWRAGALMVQRLPQSKPGILDPGSAVEDDWRRAMVLIATCTPKELLDPDLSAHSLLFRLFHEDGVRVYQPGTLHFGCRCSRSRVEQVLRTLPRAEVMDLKIDDKIQVTCEFCNTTYAFTDPELHELFEAAESDASSSLDSDEPTAE